MVLHQVGTKLLQKNNEIVSFYIFNTKQIHRKKLLPLYDTSFQKKKITLVNIPHKTVIYHVLKQSIGQAKIKSFC